MRQFFPPSLVPGFGVLLQPRLQLLRARQAAPQGRRQGFDQLRDVARHTDRLGQVAQRVFGDDLVLRLAQDDADGGQVIGVAEQIIDGRQL
jgi:hypothetical protein